MVKEEKKDKERYSFSKLSSFNTCKYGYDKRYNQHLKGIGNCFSSYGLLVHSLLERYSKGELPLECLCEVFQWEFDTSVPEPFPKSKFCPNMRELYFNQGVDFFWAFTGYGDSRILDVENDFEYEIDDWIFNGVIDLVLLDENKKLIVLDYKSKASFKTKKEQKVYARQLYLYALHVKKKYGRYPDILRFSLIRKNQVVDVPFNIKDLEEAVCWARNTVAEIRSCWYYPSNPDQFFCQNLCNFRNECSFKP